MTVYEYKSESLAILDPATRAEIVAQIAAVQKLRRRFDDAVKQLETHMSLRHSQLEGYRDGKPEMEYDLSDWMFETQRDIEKLQRAIKIMNDITGNV